MRLVRSSLLLLPLLALACDEDASLPRQSASNACVPDATGQPWTLDAATTVGPHAVGNLRVTLVDATRATPANGNDYPGDSVRTLETAISYPAVAKGEGVDASRAGPFPIVAYSHGFSSTQFENVQLFQFLASHGYVVVAPKFPLSNIGAPGGPTGIDLVNQPADVSFVIDSILGFGATVDHPLEGAIDGERIAAVGLSLGGMTTLLVTFHADLRDPRIDVAVAMAPPGSMFLPSYFDTSPAPLLVVFGDSDAIVPYDPNATTLAARARSPMSLLTFVDGTHTGFTSAALLFEGTEGYEHIDALGCNALSGIGGDAPSTDYESLLGGAEVGIANPKSWGEFCPDPLGVGMAPSRQQLLETAAVRAFLDSYFDSDAANRGRACHFSSRVLPRETDVEIEQR